MTFRRAAALGALALAAVAACKPAARGRCNETKDCRAGAYCSLDDLCLARSGTCSTACGDGAICSGSICAALKPVVSVTTPGGPLSPALPLVTIHVEAAAVLVLRGLSVQVDSSDKTVAFGSLDAPQNGDNLIVLGHFATNAVGTVSVRATLKYQVPGAAAEAQVSSVAVPASVDAAPPAVAIFVPAAQDAINGWVPRTSPGTLEVRATVDDGAGSGAQAATLSFDTCPAASQCSYGGLRLSDPGVNPAVFSFPVQRFAQAAGSEALLAVTVKATDVAGNQGQGAGMLQIDDAPPQIGNFAVVSPAGVNGEDGKTWFQGGSGAPDVEIAVAVSDSGAGLASPPLTLHLTDADVAGPDPAGVPQADGTVHFLLPASRVLAREGGMRFSLTAKDQLGLTASRAVNQINVDAKPPTFTVPHVVYSSAAPAGVCGLSDAVGMFGCGRQGGTHLLRDDSATVTFDGFDCGAGLTNSGSTFGINVTSGGQTKAVGAQPIGKDNGTCAGSSNKLHHFSAQVVLAEAVIALDPAGADGTVQITLASTGPDRAGNGAQSAAGTASPDGIALLSLWRWNVKLPNVAAGSPALLPGTAGARPVVVGTTGTSGANLFAIGPDGTQLWNATLLPDIVGDVAVGQKGTVYASTDASCMGATNTCTAVNLVQPPPSGTGTPTPVPCVAGNATFGASPAVATNSGSDLLYAVALSYGASGNNLFAFTPSATCLSPASATLANPPTDDVTGVTAGPLAAFVSNGHGFASLDQSGTGFGTQVLYDPGNAGFVVRAPPSISSSGTVGGAVFGTAGGDKKLRRAVRQTCGAGTLVPCWEPALGFPNPPPTAPSNLPYTPVFDGTTIWTIDDQGVVFTWAQLDGTVGPFLDLTETASPPVLVQGGSALVVTTGGLVKLLSVSGAPASMSAQRLVDFGTNFPPGKVPAPVLDCRAATCSGSGVAYAPAPSGWLWAVQLPAAPVAASTTVWPRPGHDSCNTRNAAESWCP